MKTVKLTFKTGYSYTTQVNAKVSDQEIKAYFEHQSFDIGAYPQEYLDVCVKVEVLP